MCQGDVLDEPPCEGDEQAAAASRPPLCADDVEKLPAADDGNLSSCGNLGARGPAVVMKNQAGAGVEQTPRGEVGQPSPKHAAAAFFRAAAQSTESSDDVNTSSVTADTFQPAVVVSCSADPPLPVQYQSDGAGNLSSWASLNQSDQSSKPDTQYNGPVRCQTDDGACSLSELSSPVHYESEGRGNLSSRTSLSALTCDDGERVGLCRQPRSLPLGQEDITAAMTTAAGPHQQQPSRITDDVNDDDVDDVDDEVDLPINEDDERRLAECSGSCTQLDRAVQQLAAVVDLSDVDSPCEFATEDTPLNVSQSVSLSDLSVGGASEMDLSTTGGSEAGLSVAGGSESCEFEQQAAAAVTTATAQDDARLSDDDVPGGDELLSYLIEAAMPEMRNHHHQQHWKQQPVSMRGRAAVATPTVTSDGAAQRPEPPVHRALRSNSSTPPEFHTTTTQHRSSSADVLDRSTTPDDLPHSGGGGTSASKLPPAPAYSWTAEPSEDLIMSYAVEGTPDSYSRDRSPTAWTVQNPLVVNELLSRTGGGVDEGSLSSLSLDSSLNAEPTPEESAPLRDCINAALPKSRPNKKNDSARRKKRRMKSSGGQQQQQQPLRTSPSGSSESSLKRHPVDLVASAAEPDLTGDSPRSQKDVVHPASSWQLPRSDNKDVSGRHPDEFSPKSQKDRVNYISGGDAEMHVISGNVSEGDTCGNIVSECLPDVGLLELSLDDDSMQSGPSTEANKIVIYVGPSLMDTGHAGSLAAAAAASQQPGDVGVAASCNVAEGEVVSEVSSADDVTPTRGVTDNSFSSCSTAALTTADFSPPNRVQHCC